MEADVAEVTAEGDADVQMSQNAKFPSKADE